MKRDFLYFLLIVSLIASCRKDDKSVFEQPVDDRLNAILAKYQAQLSGAQNGWKAIVYPAAGGAYGFYFKFNDANRVSMFSDFNSTTAVTSKESSYRLKALQQPSLIFDTYNYIHLLADPNEDAVVVSNVNNGPVGEGLKSDFEFYFDATTTDTIKLVGRFHGSKAIMVRATAAEATAYNSGLLNAGLVINNFLTYFKRLTVGTQLVDIQINTVSRSFTFTYLGANGVAQTFTTDYYFTPGGINLSNPLVIGSLTITGFNNMQWNAATETVNTTVNNVASTISGVVVPLKVDLTAASRWYNYVVSRTPNYWISFDGFHVNGVDDAYKVNSLTSNGQPYAFYIYVASFGPNYDFFGPLFQDGQGGTDLIYGTAPRVPTVTSDGRAVFPYFGDITPYPTSGPAVLSRTKLYDTRGYYFVQTSATTYDMVSALDGRAWINWEYPE